MKKILFIAVVTSFFLTSCVVVKTDTSKTMDIYGAGVIQKPVLVDLEVKETKVTGTATGTATGAAGKTMDPIKQSAVADALKKANADVLVEPVFETVTTGGKTTATVTGFPATYKNFRSIKPEDVELLKVGVTQKADVYEPPKDQQQKKNLAAAIAGTVLCLGLIIGLLGTM